MIPSVETDAEFRLAFAATPFTVVFGHTSVLSQVMPRLLLVLANRLGKP